MPDARRRLAVAAAAIATCAALTALVFWLLDRLLGDMPSPWWGALGGALAAAVSYVRTGRQRPPTTPEPFASSSSQT